MNTKIAAIYKSGRFHSGVAERSFLGDISTGVVYSRKPTYLDSACIYADCTEAKTLSQVHIYWLRVARKLSQASICRLELSVRLFLKLKELLYSSSSSIYLPYTNKIILTMIIIVKTVHGEEARKETTELIYYEPPQYR